MPARLLHYTELILIMALGLPAASCGDGPGEPAGCQADAECDDGLACTGSERCEQGDCLAGQAVVCDGRSTCSEPDGACTCQPGWTGEYCDVCAEGHVLVAGECLPGDCARDAECDDGLACNGLETCSADLRCTPGSGPDCGVHGECLEPDLACACDWGWSGEACGECAEGFAPTGGQCLPASCDLDGDCDDGLACTGQETCSGGSCAPGQTITCQAKAHCAEPEAVCTCDDGHLPDGPDCIPKPCDLPRAPVLSVIHSGATLDFQAPAGLPVQVGTSPDSEAAAPDAWLDSQSVTLPAVQAATPLRVFARIHDPSCLPDEVFAFTYEVRTAYPPPPGQTGSRAVAFDDPGIVGWATGVEEVEFGEAVDEQWQDPAQALGSTGGNPAGITSLGRGGRITLTFDPPIADGPGADFAVFENGFTDSFLEFGLVEVSSDGSTFVRFDHAFLGDRAIGAFGTTDTGLVGGMAGKYRQGFGTPFDLAVFGQAEPVRQGLVDLQAIRYVRVLDVVGDGNMLDSFGHPIFDPTPTEGSAGFDLDAIGVLNSGQ